MRLKKFEIHNYKGIETAAFEWDDIAILIGENNAGKSTVLQALDQFLGGSLVRDEAWFHNNATAEESCIELIGWFDNLTQPESESTAVKGRMQDQEWILKKNYWRDDGDGGRWSEQYFSYSCQEEFRNWPAQPNSWSNFPDEYQPLIDQIPEKGARPNAQTRERLRELVRDKSPELIDTSEPDWVPNPGGGGNWKSNANSIIPRFILVKAVHDAGDETGSKEASSYGKIVSLVVERRMVRRPELIQLRAQMEAVLKLFRPDPEHPENQAVEIKELENRINTQLNQVVAGLASITTNEPDIRPILLPSTNLVLKDLASGVETPVAHQGHGLQRTLVMTLLQVLSEIEAEPSEEDEGELLDARSVILAVEEPELYMHPQMERKMRDLLYRLASQTAFQVICTTHSPVFLDMGERHTSIVRVVKDAVGVVSFFQVTSDLFEGEDAQSDRNQLRLITSFHPTVNEVFLPGVSCSWRSSRH